MRFRSGVDGPDQAFGKAGLVVTREGYSREGWRRLGLGRLGLRTWPVAAVTTAGVCLLATTAAVVLGFERFSVQGDWPQSVLAVCVTGPILAFAEEVGWRGYLQPRLAFLPEQHGQRQIQPPGMPACPLVDPGGEEGPLSHHVSRPAVTPEPAVSQPTRRSGRTAAEPVHRTA
ncbi:CPBP family intramembrane glutamic endopeptidase [Nonomuraea typhae]|uniref:CPBP family intramembrane glutamic endopeptidase n=1 Tax=Nonomuraea typhae TaxID=2603600 RepID=UPI0012F95774|nr:CPBP family intramembrane glutamic endopeptidase [Nonomuraea typhae]